MILSAGSPTLQVALETLSAIMGTRRDVTQIAQWVSASNGDAARRKLGSSRT